MLESGFSDKQGILLEGGVRRREFVAAVDELLGRVAALSKRLAALESRLRDDDEDRETDPVPEHTHAHDDAEEGGSLDYPTVGENLAAGEHLSDGAPPPSSPAPTVRSAIGALVVTWSGISNPDPVTYEVHVSATSGFTPGPSTKVAESKGTMVWVRRLADGTVLQPGVTYYVKLVARDQDGSAAPSAEGSGQIALVTGADTDLADVGQGLAAGQHVSDGVPPASSPTPTVRSAISALIVTWSPVSNNDPVVYEVHVSATSGFTPGPATKVAEIQGTMVWVRRLPDGTPLQYGTTYYVRLIAKDLDGSASASPQASGQILKVVNTDTDLADVGQALAAGQHVSDGAPPASSPTPTVRSAISALIVTWSPVANNDPVTYEVHVSATSGFTPGPSTKVAEMQGTMVWVRRLADGSPLQYGTTYYVKLVAKDLDGAAPASAQASGQILKVVSTDTDLADVGQALAAGQHVSDGSPPASSPAPTVRSAISALIVSWTPVTNNDPVTYEVHVSATSGFTPSSTTKVMEVAGTLVWVRRLADGTPLQYGTTYYVKLVAKDLDGAAAPSVEASGQVSQITSPDIAANQVLANHIAADQIQASHIAAGAVTASELAAGAVTTDKLAAAAVTSDKIAADAILANHIAAGAVTASEIAADAVQTSHIAANAVTASKIAAEAIQTDHLAASSVTSDKLAADSVLANHIAAGAVTASEIAADAVQTSHIAANAVTAAKVAAEAIQTGHLAAEAVTSEKIAADAITSQHISSGSVLADDILVGQITAEHLAAVEMVSNGLIRAGSPTGQHVDITPDGVTLVAADGTILADFPTDGARSPYFSGEVVAKALQVLGSVLLNNTTLQNTGTFVLERRVASPLNPPGVAVGFPASQQLRLRGDSVNPNALYDWFGLFYTASGGAAGTTPVYWTTRPGGNGYYRYIQEHLASDGSFNRSFVLPEASVDDAWGVVQLTSGGTRYVYVLYQKWLSTPRYYLARYRADTLQFVDETNITSYIVAPKPGLFTDGTNLYVLTTHGTSDSTHLHLLVFTPSLTYVSTIDLDNSFTIGGGSGGGTAFESGGGVVVNGKLYLALYTYPNAPIKRRGIYAFDWTTKARVPSEDFYGSGGEEADGVTHDGTRFRTVLYKGPVVGHSDWTDISAPVWVAHTWFDNTNTYETTVSPLVQVSMRRRWWLLVSWPSFPSGVNRSRVYAAISATNPGASGLKRQGTYAGSSANIGSYNASGAAPPSSNTFPGVGHGAELRTSDGAPLIRADGISRCRYVMGSGVMNPGNSTDVTIAFGTAHREVDTDSYNDPNNALFTAPFTGQYEVKCSVQWAANATGRRRLWAECSTNGGGTWTALRDKGAADDRLPVSGTPTVQSFSVMLSLTQGDKIRFRVNQNSGGALAINSATMSMTFLGPA